MRKMRRGRSVGRECGVNERERERDRERERCVLCCLLLLESKKEREI